MTKRPYFQVLCPAVLILAEVRIIDPPSGFSPVMATCLVPGIGTVHPLCLNDQQAILAISIPGLIPLVLSVADKPVLKTPHGCIHRPICIELIGPHQLITMMLLLRRVQNQARGS
jgi:hypothetical protein